MSELETLTVEQVAALRRQLNNRPTEALSTVLRGKPLPPLPPCPACGASAERVDERVEDPQFDVYDMALRLRWLPCGHRFRAVVDPSAGLVGPGEETT